MKNAKRILEKFDSWKYDIYENNKWIGFCQKRRFWLKNKNREIKNIQDLKNSLLNKIPKEWENYDAFLCEPIYVSPAKKMKLIKRQNINNNQLEISLSIDNHSNIMRIREELKNQVIRKL